MRIVSMLVNLVLMASLIAVSPSGHLAAVYAQEPTAQPADAPPAPLVERARQDLARRLGIGTSQVTVAETSPMTWSSLALGCPAPGLAYAEVETPGFQLLLDTFGQQYRYHTDTGETVVACIEGQGVTDSQVLSASGLMAALLERGFRVEIADAYAELPFLRADGTRYRLDGPGLPAGVELQVYDYRDPAIATSDVAQIGPDGQPTAEPVAWTRPPIFFRSGSVLALTFDGARPFVDTLTELLGEPFAGAAGIGAPPPPPPGSSPPTSPPGSMPPSSHPPADPNVPRVSWDEAKALITSGQVTHAFQTHALEVTLRLTDGSSVVTTEPQIDDVFRVIRECGDPCANIMIATE